MDLVFKYHVLWSFQIWCGKEAVVQSRPATKISGSLSEGRVLWPLPFSSFCSVLQLRGRNSARDELGEPFEPPFRKGHLFSSSGLFILFTCPVMTGATCSKGTKGVFSEVWGRIRSSAIDKPQLASFHPVNKRPCACTVAPLSPAASKPGQAPPISDADSGSSAELCFLVQTQLRTLHMVFACLLLSSDSPRPARHFFQERSLLQSRSRVWLPGSTLQCSFISRFTF